MQKQESMQAEASVTTERKGRLSKNSIIAHVKWFTTADGNNVYSYLPKTMPNRSKKEELATALKKKNMPVTILSKEVSFKATGEKINSYIFITDSKQFASAFPSVVSKATNINFGNSKKASA